MGCPQRRRAKERGDRQGARVLCMCAARGSKKGGALPGTPYQGAGARARARRGAKGRGEAVPQKGVARGRGGRACTRVTQA